MTELVTSETDQVTNEVTNEDVLIQGIRSILVNFTLMANHLLGLYGEEVELRAITEEMKGLQRIDRLLGILASSSGIQYSYEILFKYAPMLFMIRMRFHALFLDQLCVAGELLGHGIDLNDPVPDLVIRASQATARWVKSVELLDNDLKAALSAARSAVRLADPGMESAIRHVFESCMHDLRL